MKITNLTSYAVNKGKVKANGTVTLEGCVDLKYILLQGPQELFVSWAGGKQYTKKDGTKGWDSPIYISDSEFSKEVTAQAVAKYNSLAAKNSPDTGAAAPSANVAADPSFASDDIPF